MAKKKRLETLDLDDIIVDEDFQARADGYDEDQIEQLVDVLKSKGGSLPRVKIYDVKAMGLVLTDGFGRVEAHKRAGLKVVQAEVFEGSLLDATLAAAQANADQVARRRTNADKRRAVEMLLRRLMDAEQDWSDRKIAEAIGVSHPLVSDIRQELGGTDRQKKGGDSEEIPLVDRPTRSGRDGVERSQPKKTEDDWKTIRLEEFLKADPYAWSCLKDFNVVTAGQLADKIASGEKMGLTAIDFKDLSGQIEKLKAGAKMVETKIEPKEKPREQGAVRDFSLTDFERSLRELVCSVDDFAFKFNDKKAVEHGECIRLLTEFEKCFTGWRKRHQPGK